MFVNNTKKHNLIELPETMDSNMGHRTKRIM